LLFLDQATEYEAFAQQVNDIAAKDYADRDEESLELAVKGSLEFVVKETCEENNQQQRTGDGADQDRDAQLIALQTLEGKLVLEYCLVQERALSALGKSVSY
jgi:hypothetical protein